MERTFGVASAVLGLGGLVAGLATLDYSAAGALAMALPASLAVTVAAATLLRPTGALSGYVVLWLSAVPLGVIAGLAFVSFGWLFVPAAVAGLAALWAAAGGPETSTAD